VLEGRPVTGPSSPEDELDQAIWRALRVYKVTVGDPLGLAESIRLAAQAYAAKDSAMLTRARRMVLREPHGKARP
jgi:hypothetical protein